MAVTSFHLTTNTSTTNSSPITTASITPTANRLVLAHVVVVGTGSATPTLSGNGLTWVLITDTGSGVTRQLAVYRAMGASPSAGVVTISSASTTITGWLWSISEYDGIDTSGTNGSGAVVQSVQAKPTAVTSVSTAFGSGITAGNGTSAGVAINLAETFTAGSGWTAQGQITGSAPVQAIIGMFGTSGVGVSPIAASWTTSGNAWVTGVEIKAAAAAGAAAPPVRVINTEAASRSSRW